MNGIAFWSWAYGMTSQEHSSFLGYILSKPQALAVRLARKFKADPIIRLEIGDRSLLMPWSHNLPAILRKRPLYQAEIGRLACHLCETHGEVVMIDAGANIGYTIARLPRLDQAKFLCIEGSERYYGLLQKNCESDPRVKPVFAWLTDSLGLSNNSRLKEAKGTAEVGTTEGSVAAAPSRTLDELLETHPEFKNANLFKSDTAGYDLRVLKGSTAFLQRTKASLHIEFSPQLWRRYGNCQADEGLSFLSGFGYKEVLVYDNFGNFIARDRTDRPRVLGVLADYTKRHPPWWYLILIAFHETRKDLEQFYGSEVDTASTSAK